MTRLINCFGKLCSLEWLSSSPLGLLSHGCQHVQYIQTWTHLKEQVPKMINSTDQQVIIWLINVAWLQKVQCFLCWIKGASNVWGISNQLISFYCSMEDYCPRYKWYVKEIDLKSLWNESYSQKLSHHVNSLVAPNHSPRWTVRSASLGRDALVLKVGQITWPKWFVADLNRIFTWLKYISQSEIETTSQFLS